MNRLWVRLSLLFSSIILVAILMPLVAFTVFVLTHDPPAGNQVSFVSASPLALPLGSSTALTTTLDAALPAGAPAPPPFRNPWRDIPADLLRSFVIAGVLGVIGGIAASRWLAAPIARLAAATHAIGAGDLSTRVPINRSSAELEELTAAFNKMAADLQRAAELRTSLMADVSHELRTPLTALEGNLRAALDHVYELDEEQIANLYEQTRHLIRLVNDLRELALAEAAQLPLDLHPLDLTPLVEETGAIFELLAEEKGIHLILDLPPALPCVEADRARIRQVLHNLLANALRHTPDGGTITVALRQVDHPFDGVALAVSDTGEGIDQPALPHVFDRFYRTDPSRSRETGGSGLGLAIVKAIVETHGGTVEAASDGRGCGSTFTLRLPVEGDGVSG